LIDEIAKISENMPESTPSSQVQEAAPSLDRLTQGMVSTAKQEAGGTVGSTSHRDSHELGELAQTPDRRKRTENPNALQGLCPKATKPILNCDLTLGNLS
jgi:hypothetical protein